MRIEDGVANFTDHSVTPNFSATIQDLKGGVDGLSSKPHARATVDLHGDVDRYSPVSITGRVNVLGPLYTDLKMDFRNIELSIFNPYSGKFAGYEISKGKLTTELHYKIDHGRLDAQHHIVIDQLEFGAKTASKDAVSLPVKLAAALLKDRHGVIDLDLPVTGSLDDPKFRIGPLIWKVLVNILEKAVTAPFALLGSMFGGGPDLQFVEFQPGSSELEPAQRAKVASLAKALEARPQLKIELPIASVPDLDRPALIQAAFEAQIARAEAADRKRRTANAAPADFERLAPAPQLEVLKRAYEAETGSAPRYPESVAAAKDKAASIAAKIGYLRTALREHVSVGDQELRILGEQRAAVLQQALLDGTQLTADRVFLVSNDKASAKNGAVSLQLALR